MSILNKLIFSAALVVAAAAFAACGTDASSPPTAQPTVAPTAAAIATAAPTAVPTPATATLVPTTVAPTVVPTPTAITSAPATSAKVSTDALIAELADDAWANLVELTEDFSPRESGTEQERMAADYLVGEFRSMGYHAELQPFTFEFLSRDMPVLKLISLEGREIEGFHMGLSAIGRASGILVDVGKALSEDLPPGGIQGKIAFIQRGTITFEEKVARVARAGALAAVIYNNESGGFGGRLANQSSIPAVSISKESGESIKELMASSEVEATVSLVQEMRDSRNVVAEKPGTAGDGKVVILGGHFDTVPGTQGANDNGSGTATLLTVARAILGKPYPFTIRFIAFGSEELGLFGSRSYVDSLTDAEREAIVAMLNFDVPGSGDAVELEGSLDLIRQVLGYGKEKGIEVKVGTPLQGASSDHATFIEAGIPAVMFLADDLSRLHTPEDRIEFVRPELMGAAAALGIGLLDLLAES